MSSGPQGTRQEPWRTGIEPRLERDAHREQAQGVECHRGFGDQPLRAGTHEKGGQDLGGPGIGSSEHIGEDAATHHREDDACADHAMHAQSGGGVIGDAPRHRGWWLEHLARKRAEGSSVPRTSIQPMRLVVADGTRSDESCIYAGKATGHHEVGAYRPGKMRM